MHTSLNLRTGAGRALYGEYITIVYGIALSCHVELLGGAPDGA